jgi:hypothetical protein
MDSLDIKEKKSIKKNENISPTMKSKFQKN